MTNEEREIISQFIARVGGAQQPAQFGSGGSVPATQPLPAVDRDADTLIAQQFQQYPEARYRITQLAFVQEHALVEAQNRIRRLEWELQQAQQALQQAQQQPQGRQGGGFFSNLFGGSGGARQGPPQGGPGPWGQQAGPQQGYYPPPPQPQYPPGYNPGVFQRQGSGFLGSALTTAAGVAGGIVAGNALMNLFSGGHSAASAFGGAATPSPWTAPAAVDQGTWDNNAGAIGGGQDYTDSGTWDQPNNTDQSWDNNSGGGDWGGGGGGSDWGGGATDDDTF
jgi:hypothetical protein